MNNKNNNIKLAVLTAIIITASFLINTAPNKASALNNYIPYSQLDKDQATHNMIGFHSHDRYIWYLNDNNNGFTLYDVLTDEQQKLLDEGN